MNTLLRAVVLAPMLGAAFCCNAGDSDCFADDVNAHVVEQFAVYGPLSANREYFGFIYRDDAGLIASAITRGGVCRTRLSCEVNTRAAALLIPEGAKVLGEWHTHPHSTGSRQLSAADVRGAHQNRRIRCYRAFFSSSDGEIFSWSPNDDSVWVAMARMERLGNYR